LKIVRPKRPRWLLAAGIVAVGSWSFFLFSSSRRVWSPRSAEGVAFGIAAAMLVFIQVLYPLRRRLGAFPFGTIQRWLQFHIYGGLLACWFVLIHAGFRVPSGFVGWTLVGLAAWGAATGLIGVWLQKWIPAMMSSGLSVVAVFDRIPGLVDGLRKESAALAAGSSEIFERFYADEVRPALTAVTTSWDYLLDVQGGRDRRLAPFGRMLPYLAETERERLADLKAIFAEKLELDAQYSLLRILRVWTVFHVPPTVLLVGLIFFHIAVNVHYWWRP